MASKYAEDLLTDPHLLETGILQELSNESEDNESVWTTITPVQGNKITATQDLYPPDLGEHTREILRELGFSDNRIKEYDDSGVI